jgi:hypothetical protein
LPKIAIVVKWNHNSEDAMPNNKRKKMDTAVIVAIIGLSGTVIAALFSSPVLIALLERKTPTAPPTETSPTDGDRVLVFSQDFEDDTTSGFAFDEGDWKIIRDKSNKVLEGIADVSTPDIYPSATFGPSDFADGVVEFKIKFNQFTNDESASLHFRYTNQATYSVLFMQDNIGLGYRDMQIGGNFVPLSEETYRPFNLAVGTWYGIRLEARGDRFSLYVDGNRLFSASDNRLQRGRLIFAIAPGFKVTMDNVKVWSSE